MDIEEEYRKINDAYFDDRLYEISNFGKIRHIKTKNTRTPFKGRIQLDSYSRKTFSIGRHSQNRPNCTNLCYFETWLFNIKHIFYIKNF